MIMGIKALKDKLSSNFNIQDDPLYSIIKRNKVTNFLYKEITFLNHCASILGFISFIIGMISIFYEAKAHLQIMGLAAIFHIFGSLGSEYFKKKRNRYLLLAVALCNVSFLAVAQIFLTLYILIADSATNPSKSDFKTETFFHVILFPWVLSSILIAILFLILVIYLVTNDNLSVDPINPGLNQLPTERGTFVTGLSQQFQQTSVN
ncbi:uncharacterized protein LOC107370127 [Tetranychus urticae]|uniref:uncharacterized protein LOC107370127 n=1 Tax=Tetranychus urticae TaxID=32264 RepID=UPI00077BE33E|nr:uncharacterized protein LOC107370127 [Tetranychus urticae]